MKQYLETFKSKKSCHEHVGVYRVIATLSEAARLQGVRFLWWRLMVFYCSNVCLKWTLKKMIKTNTCFSILLRQISLNTNRAHLIIIEIMMVMTVSVQQISHTAKYKLWFVLNNGTIRLYLITQFTLLHWQHKAVYTYVKKTLWVTQTWMHFFPYKQLSSYYIHYLLYELHFN